MAKTIVSFEEDERLVFDAQPDAQAQLDQCVTSRLNEWRNQQRKRLAEQFIAAMDSKDSVVMAATAILKAHVEADEQAIEAAAVLGLPKEIIK